MSYGHTISRLVKKLNDSDIINGLSWYPIAREKSLEISEKLGVDFLKTAGVISALSPAVRWEINLKDAENLLFYLVNDLDHIPTVSTYGNNVLKAIKIFESDGKKETISNILLGKSGFKTKNFFLNIIGEPQAVTIDRHILSALNFKEKSLTKKRYYNLEKAFQRIANNKNYNPMDLQAAIWVYYKRVNNI